MVDLKGHWICKNILPFRGAAINTSGVDGHGQRRAFIPHTTREYISATTLHIRFGRKQMGVYEGTLKLSKLPYGLSSKPEYQKHLLSANSAQTLSQPQPFQLNVATPKVVARPQAAETHSTKADVKIGGLRYWGWVCQKIKSNKF